MTAPLDPGKPMRRKGSGPNINVLWYDDYGALVIYEDHSRAYLPMAVLTELFENIPPEPPKPVGPDEVTVSVWPDGAMSLMHGHPPAVQVRYLRADLAARKVKPLNKCEIGAFRAAYNDASMMSRFRAALAVRGIEVGE